MHKPLTLLSAVQGDTDRDFMIISLNISVVHAAFHGGGMKPVSDGKVIPLDASKLTKHPAARRRKRFHAVRAEAISLEEARKLKSAGSAGRKQTVGDAGELTRKRHQTSVERDQAQKVKTQKATKGHRKRIPGKRSGNHPEKR